MDTGRDPGRHGKSHLLRYTRSLREGLGYVTRGGRFTGIGMRGFPGVGIDEGERKVPRWVYRWQVKPPDKSHLG